jgi:hypothetical protein
MSLLEDIVSASQQCLTLQKDLFAAITNALAKVNQQDLEKETIPEYWETINSIQARLLGFLTLAQSISEKNLDIALVTRDYLKKFLDAIIAINGSQSEIVKNLSRIEQNQGFGKIDVSNFVISNTTNDQTFALGQGLIHLDTTIDRALERYYLLSATFTADIQQVSAFTTTIEAALDEVKQARANAKKDASNINNLQNEIKKIHEQIIIVQKQASEDLSQTSKSKELGQNSLQEMKQHLAASENLLTRAKTIDETATDLKNKIQTHHGSLDEFDAEMKTRVKTSTEGQKILDTLISGFKTLREECDIYCKEKKDEVEKLIKRAEDMLGISTSAGLGDTFKNRANSRALAIKFNYVVMLLSLTTIAGLGVWTAYEAHENFNPSAFLIRLAVIIPLSVLASISVRTMRKLEKSKEQYEHKTAVSYAVEGYRKLFTDGQKQEENQTELIKSAIKEVLKDPSDGLHYSNADDDTVLGVLERFAKILKLYKDKN